MNKLEQAAREVVKQYSMECLSDKAVDALREALAEQDSWPSKPACEDDKKVYDTIANNYLSQTEQAEQSSDSERMEPVAEALRLSEEAIEYARQGGKVGSGIYGKALTAIRNVLGENNGTRNLDGDSEYSSNGDSHNRSVSRTPVAWVTPDGEGWRMRFDPPINDVPLGWSPLYAAPVRTKDLTDDEIRDELNSTDDVNGERGWIRFARAVIAADREKNK